MEKFSALILVLALTGCDLAEHLSTGCVALTVDSESISDADFDTWQGANERIALAAGFTMNIVYDECHSDCPCITEDSIDPYEDRMTNRIAMLSDSEQSVMFALLKYMRVKPAACLDEQTLIGICDKYECSRFKPEELCQ